MKEMFKITMSLVVIFAAAGIIMAGVYAKTSPIRAAAEKREKEEALKKLMPEADTIKEAGKWEPFGKHAEYYEAMKDGKIVGYIASTYGKGYSSYISILVAVDPSFRVKQISILEHGETPGLGDEIEQEYFRKRFEGKSLDQLVVVKVEGTDKVQAISGATISSRGVTNGVREAVKFLKEKYQGGQVAKQ
jgi:H+/Na+-translocating ferredoxin:NAD+ oxidoreductase subunit G